MTDVRLVLPALTSWLCAGLALTALSRIDSSESRHHLAIAVCIAALALAAIGLFLLRRRPGPFVVVAASALAALSAGAQFATWTASDLTDAMGKTVHVRAEVDGPPRSFVGVEYLPVRTIGISVDGSSGPSRSLQVPITLSLPEVAVEDDSALAMWPVGAEIVAVGRLRPAGGSIRTAGYLDVSDRSDVSVTRAPGPVDRVAERMRRMLNESLPRTPSGGSALVAGLAIGDEALMSPQLVEDMRASGLAHLTAVSGGNVAIVVGAVLAIAWVLRLSMMLRIAVSLGALAFYVILVHPQPSVLRAGVMGAVVILSLLIGGRRPGPSVLATAVLVLVILTPSLALSWGFALSVAATGGIVMLSGVFRSWLEKTPWGSRVPAAVLIAASLTLGAQLATAPVLIAMGVSVGIVSVPANLLAMPVVPIVTIAGLLAAILGATPGLLPPASLVALIGAWVGEWIAQVATIAAGVDILRFQGSPILAGVVVVALACAVLAWRHGMRVGVVVSALLVAGTGVLWSVAPPSSRSWPPADWAVVQCDVGQGDGLVIAGDGGAVVVDTGFSARAIDTCLDDLGVDHVAAVILTHFHSDHVGGLEGLLSGRSVDAVFATPFAEPEAQVNGVERILQRRGIELRQLTAGASVRVGSGTYSILWPKRIITAGQVSSGSVANNASVVIDASVHGLRLLLTGDIEPPAQAALLGLPTAHGGFDIVKIPHHGSGHQHPDFASWAQADVALISVGADNEFGHPAEETIRSWQETGAVVFRTDRHGDIAIAPRKTEPVQPDRPESSWHVIPRRGSLP